MVRKAARRVRAFEAQLPDVLMAMASSLRVGLTFTHSMAAIVDDGQAPACEEFERVLNETELGRPMEDALSAMADRIDSEDLRFVLMSVVIQREVGGSLANLFQTVSETVRERQHFRLKVRALTSMGGCRRTSWWRCRSSSSVSISLLSPGLHAPAVLDRRGRVLIVVALAMMGIGSLFLKKIVSVKG